MESTAGRGTGAEGKGGQGKLTHEGRGYRTTRYSRPSFLLFSPFLYRPSRFGFRALDNAVSEVGVFKSIEEKQ